MKYLDCSHSDNNLVKLEKVTIKEDDRAVLLEGGVMRTASLKFHSSSIKMNLMRLFATSCSNLTLLYGVPKFLIIFFTFHCSRFMTMDDSFLLENRATFRAM